MTPTVSLTGVEKSYGRTRAVAGVDLAVEPGIVGLLGPNGAGKTTLMRMLATVLAPDGGRVRLLGHDPADAGGRLAIRRRLGYVPQEPGYHRNFTAFEFVDYVAILKEMTDRRARHDEVRRVLELVGLADVSGKRIKALSGGMRRRVALAQALLGAPDLLVLDEPTAGLDPEQRLRFREVVSAVATDATVVLSTHQTEDVSAVCQRVVVCTRAASTTTGRCGAWPRAPGDGCGWRPTVIPRPACRGARATAATATSATPRPAWNWWSRPSRTATCSWSATAPRKQRREHGRASRGGWRPRRPRTPGGPGGPVVVRVVRALARVEARRLLRHPSFLIGTALTVLLIDAAAYTNILPEVDSAAVIALVLMGWATLIATNLAALRSRRDGADELFGSLPTSATARPRPTWCRAWRRCPWPSWSLAATSPTSWSTGASARPTSPSCWSAPCSSQGAPCSASSSPGGLPTPWSRPSLSWRPSSSRAS